MDDGPEGARSPHPALGWEVLEGSPALVAIFDQEGRIVRCNGACAALAECEPEDLEGCELWELVAAEEVDSVKRLFGHDGDPCTNGPIKIHWLTGDQPRQTVWSFNRVADAEQVVGVGLDTDGHAGNDTTGPLRSLVEYSSDVVCVMSMDGTLSYVNPAARTVLDYDPEELVGSSGFDLIHSDDLEAAKEAIAKGLENPDSIQEVELRVRHRDSSWRKMEARGIVQMEDDEAQIVVTLSDVTERRIAEARLAESEERFRGAFEHTAIGKALWSLDGRLLRVNKSVCDILGYPEAELLAKDWRNMCHPDDVANLRRKIKQLLVGKIQSARTVIRVLHKDGPWIWNHSTLAVARDANGKPYNVIGELEDITEQRRSEEEKRGRLRRLERQQSALVTMATHDAVVSGDLEAAARAITESAADAIEVERVGVWLLSDDRSELRCFDLHQRSSREHSSGTKLDTTTFQAYFEALDAGRVIDADDARSDPRTEAFTEAYLRPNGVTSMLDAPIRIAGRVIGVVCHEQVGEPRLWQSDEIKFAGEVADQLANATVNEERRLAEVELERSEERFRSIVHSSPMGMFSFQLEHDGRLVLVGANPAADTILGVDCQQFIGMTIEEAFPPLADTEVPDRYRRTAAEGEAWSTEVPYEDDQIRGTYEINAFQTGPGRMSVLFIDITDRKHTEEELRDSEQRYRLLFERNLAGVFRSTVEGKVLECNEAFARILGCPSPEDVLSRNAEDFYPNAKARAILLGALEMEGELRNYEIVLKRIDGTPVWVLANMSVVSDDDGQPGIIEGTMADITQRKKAAERLVLQSTALESAANAIAITDPRGVIEWVNQAFTRLTGHAAADAIGDGLQLISGQEGSSLYDEMWETVSGGRVWRGELVNRRHDGRQYTGEVTVTPVRDSDGDIIHFIAVMQDISERKRIEEQLLQAQKMEAVGRLAGGVAHDFNNLLQAMLGLTELLRQPDIDAGDAHNKLEELEELVQRGSQLTRQLLLFSRRDTPRREQLDLNEVVQGTVKLLSRLIRENIELSFDSGEEPVQLVADRGQVEQVVMNLAVNACDAMPHGGRLMLRAGVDADHPWLEVEDTGQGIPEEVQEHLFEPFFTTKERGKGTGLGLSVVHGIVTRLGGHIDLESRIDEGTTIRINFPAFEFKERPPSGPVDSRPVPGGDGERVLVVEDDPAVRASLEEILAVLGYRVTTVDSRESVEEHTTGAAFDLLLTDFVLPDGSGTDIAEDLRDMWPDIGVIVMSGYAQDDVRGTAALANLRFLQKPFNAQTLSSAVRSVLAERRSRIAGAHADDVN